MARADDEAEPDLAWKGYASAAMLPSFVACAVAAALLLTGGWFFEDVRVLGEQGGWFLFFGTAVAIWVAQVTRWLYRGAAYVYRLTPKHLFLDWGFLHNPVPPVELARVERVAWGYPPLGRPFRVGWVRVWVEGGRELYLPGIQGPEEFAGLIEKNARSARSARG